MNEMNTKRNYIDITGQKFGHLTAIEMVGRDKSRCAMWRCACDCGAVTTVRGKDLRNGSIRSCGCTRKTEGAEKIRKASTHHGMTGTRLYGIWCGMKTRCTDTHRKKYNDYGGRGITVCDEWQKFEPFRDWALANGYRDDLTIDRIDNAGGYSPENCRWTTQKEQQNNRRDNRLIVAHGQEKTMQQWADETGIKAMTIQRRLAYGWSSERAVTAPVRRIAK